MRKTVFGLAAAAFAVPLSMAVPTSAATAATAAPAPTTSLFSSAAVPLFATAAVAEPQRRDRRYREWRGRDGRYYCRRPDGTTGLIVGAAGGALVGRAIDTRGDRTLGTLGGAVAGGLLGREVERSGSRRRCR